MPQKVQDAFETLVLCVVLQRMDYLEAHPAGTGAQSILACLPSCLPLFLLGTRRLYGFMTRFMADAVASCYRRGSRSLRYSLDVSGCVSSRPLNPWPGDTVGASESLLLADVLGVFTFCPRTSDPCIPSLGHMESIN